MDVDLNDFISNFAYPVIHPDRDLIVKELRDNDVEVRPLVCGSMGKQPFYIKQWGTIDLPHANEVDNYGLYVPNNPKLTEDEVVTVANLVNDVICKDTQ